MSSLPQSVEVPTDAPARAEAAPLRLVLFGLPAAGKSSLLGALLQTAEVQPALLKGGLVDDSQKLNDLRQRVYFTNQPTRTVEEVVPYPVQYRPLPEPGEEVLSIPAILIDCDGQAAIDLLRRRKSLTELSAERALARAVLDADALLLIIDASAPVKQMETDFEEFSQFLSQMELSRGARTDVGGLPVFLVLTKCDLLSRPDLPRSQWQKQIEERQRYIGERFKSFIRRRRSEQERRTFGRVDLYQAATATGQPAFVDAGARSLEPFGVGPLFQQAFEKAAQYQQRRRKARKRLFWTIGLAGVVAGVLLMLLLWLVLTPHNPFTPDLRTPAQRLAGTPRDLEERLKSLIDKREGPDFSKLHPGRREEIRNQISELQEYLVYYQKILAVGWPGVVESEKRLAELRDTLSEKLQPKAEWAKTTAAQFRNEYLGDAEILLEKASEARRWYSRVGDRLRDLWAFRDEKPPINWREYPARSDRELADAVAPFTESEPVRKGVGDLKWSNVLRIDTVKQAREKTDDYQGRVEQVRKVAGALGLAALGQKYPDVLCIPPGTTLAQSIERTGILDAAYRNHRNDLKISPLPEMMRAEVEQAAETNYRYLVPAAQGEILRQLQKSGGDTRAGWKAVRSWLQAPKELAEWRTLVGAVNQLRLPPPADPVADLSQFLDRESFPLRLNVLQLSIPLSLEFAPNRESVLEIYQPRVSGEKPVASFRFDEDGTRRDLAANRLQALFRRQGEPLTFTPGDDIYATLKLPDGKVLAWRTGERSSQYRFERLARPAQVDGRSERDILLTVREAEGGLPRVPDLLPEVPAR